MIMLTMINYDRVLVDFRGNHNVDRGSEEATQERGKAKRRLKNGKDWEIKIGFREPGWLGSKESRKIAEFIDSLQKP